MFQINLALSRSAGFGRLAPINMWPRCGHRLNAIPGTEVELAFVSGRLIVAARLI
jgi:hypothetical protein